MRRLGVPLALALALTALPAQAQSEAQPVESSTLSREIAQKGIAPVLERLHALPSPAPEERFAIAGLEFLGAVEGAWRWRMEYGITTFGAPLFGFSTELPQAVAPKPMPPEALAQQTEATLAAMARSRAALDGLAGNEDFGLAISLGDLWFDIDGDGRRAPGEGAAELLDGIVWSGIPALDPETGEPVPPVLPVIRFDNADAAWLAAYTHLVSGGAELLLAFDPTPSLEKVFATRARIDESRRAGNEGALPRMMDDVIDPLAIAIDMLRNQPDAGRTRAARAHWQQTIAENRQFWTLVGQETDNAGEWIPNDRQVSATGIAFPPGTGAAWQGVLADGEALLAGDRTIPFWRAPLGIDLGAWLENPAPLPVDGVFQGWALADHFSDAPPVSPENFQRFSDMLLETGPFLAMVMLN
ncbi:hypothetical protein [Paracoccus denitrificans]|uniref:Uncharacterized protein n=1 Tax=Paracoccus denitrificans (strain Pd 1222) TaxID=318586 RepID=A1BBB1_PARDP|nr:hypothetical protein [Paracoccus denitrificans]ABL72805.1 hypothetical protein Pden_4744 [Paracoccus denitrificans PD1222]MBB4626284.1 hypothetical protein [Paracoccus denitrificans]MCU7427511.1 hypothetical protein [Paracoccus denitrificans]QAR29763.1 hypothetical protein EO213_25935 [Paracoccus denitrificans]UPV98455.1 hypothetical protein M0K93_23110 [Paracoccus denitrificans]